MPNDEYVGKQLGNYQIVRLLGEGGFAQVYLGEHIYLKTTVAIKVLLTNLSENDLQDFLDEARMVAHLRHPHVVRVLEFGINNKRIPFLVMSLCYGTLRQRHPKGTIVPLKQVVAYGKQVAAALQYAHDQKLVHRDVKPENMLLGRNSDVLLSDFGIAVAARNTLSQSKEKVVGTVAYMAPEQLQGKPRAASDQYSLGIVVYEWLCGSLPFNGSNYLQMAVHHLNTSPQPLRERVPSLSTKVEAVVMRALAKEAAERFPTIQAFAEALEDASTANTALPHVSMPTSSIPVTSSSSFSPVITPSAQVAISQINPWNTTKASNFATGVDRAIVRSNRISRRAMTAVLGGVVGLGMVAGGVAWFALTHMQSQPSVPPKVRQRPFVLLPSYPVGTTLTTHSQHTDVVTGVTWSPDGRWIASSSNDKTVHVWPATEHIQGMPLTYTGHADAVNAVAWYPNGLYIASASKDQTVHVWDAPGNRNSRLGNTLVVYSESPTDVPGFAWSPALAWSPDSKRIASTGGMAMQVWDAETGKHALYYSDPAQNVPTSASGPASSVAWSPNGLYLVSGMITVAIWDVANTNRNLTYGGHGFTIVHGLAWSPDNKRVASAGEDKTVQVWDANTGGTFLTYKGHADAVNAVAWSSDGKYLASASRDKTVQVWDATTGKLALTYSEHTASVNALVWSPDSRHIASAGDDKKVLVWQAT